MLDALTAADAVPAAALSAGFGWPHRVADWAWFLGLGQGVGWRVGATLMGTAMMFPLGAAHGAIGLVQVAPALQGRGIGRRLMDAVMALGAGRSLRLHATAEGLGLYSKLGFGRRGIVQQWQGIVSAGQTPGRMATQADMAEVRALDRAATGLDREALLRAVFEAGTVALHGPAGAPTGYAVRRRFGHGVVIGPVVAQGPAEAAALVMSLQEPGFMRLDVPAGCGITEALGEAALASVGDVQVMVRGAWPEPAGMAVFGLASQASG